MKKFLKIILIFVFVITAYFYITANSKNKTTHEENTPEKKSDTDQSSIIGCYKVKNNKDVYTLTIDTFNNGQISGSLDFDNFEKDSSSGTFIGSYENNILFGDYTFMSEGSVSIMQVIFKKDGDSFVRGYGPVDKTGTNFIDLENIVYEEDNLSVFIQSKCSEPSVAPMQLNNEIIFLEINNYLNKNFLISDFNVEKCENNQQTCFGSGAILAVENETVTIYDLVSTQESRKFGVKLNLDNNLYYVSVDN